MRKITRVGRQAVLHICRNLLLCLYLSIMSLQAATYAAFVMDAKSSKIYHAHNSQAPVHPASLTKMMTLFILFEELDRQQLSLDSPIKFSGNATRQSPSKLGVIAGHSITVKEAILSLLTRSANDTAMAVAETLEGTEQNFVNRMNRMARTLGMLQTRFQNPHGLPNRHQLTTARDMARLAQALLQKFPNHYRYFNTKSFDYKGQKIHNHNKLLGHVEGLDGIKTGFTCASGFNIATSALRNGQRLIAVVMGGETSHWRNKRVSQLLESAFSQRQTGRSTPVLLNAVASSSLEEDQLSSIDWTSIDQLNEKSKRTETPLKNVAQKSSRVSPETIGQNPILMPTKASKTWMVQVDIGAFKTTKEAQKKASKLFATVPKNRDSKMNLTAAIHKKNKSYQACLGNFDKGMALRIKESLKRQGICSKITRV